jgi:glycosyltransferase involved in cell wall biosynthesis
MTSGLIAIPAYNEEANLGGVLTRIRACAAPEDVLVIDDGSRDRTAEIARAHGVLVAPHGVNRGYAIALQTGMGYALDHGYDYLVFLDADGQHDAGNVADLRARAQAADQPDIVIGSRFVRKSDYRASPGRRLGMAVFSWLTLIGGRRIYDTTSGFKLLRRRAIEVIRGRRFNDFHAEVIIFSLLAGLRVEEVPITVEERVKGESMYRWFDAVRYPAKTLAAIALLLPEARRLRRDRARQTR